jgi:hypothetical protein
MMLSFSQAREQTGNGSKKKGAKNESLEEFNQLKNEIS